MKCVALFKKQFWISFLKLFQLNIFPVADCTSPKCAEAMHTHNKEYEEKEIGVADWGLVPIYYESVIIFLQEKIYMVYSISNFFLKSIVLFTNTATAAEQWNKKDQQNQCTNWNPH